ncbi:MAG: hypothetical protein ABEJ82_06670 [Haloplanus sp.]
MRRRHLLAALTAGLAGCPGNAEGPPTRTATPTPTTPDLPYRATDPDENVELARGVAVHNRTDESGYVTVVVADGEREVFVGSRSVPAGQTVHFDGLVTRRGTYRVVVETADGARAVHDWVVTDRWSGRSLSVSLTPDGVETSQFAFCTPACPPMESSGTAVSLPQEDPTDPGRETAGAVLLHSRRDHAAPVRLVVRRDRTLIDYTYRLPAGVTAIVAVADRPGTYDVRVEGPDGALAVPWHLPEEPALRVATTANGVVRDCETARTRVATVRNRSEVTRRVHLTVAAGGRTRLDRTVRLDPGATLLDPVTAPATPPLRVRASTADRTLDATWTVCPPSTLSLFVLTGTIYLETDTGRLVSDRATAE